MGGRKAAFTLSMQLSHLARAARHGLRSHTWHGVHSPFVFSLVKHVFRNDLPDKWSSGTAPNGPERSSQLEHSRMYRQLSRLVRHLNVVNLLEIGDPPGSDSILLTQALRKGNLITLSSSDDQHASAHRRPELTGVATTRLVGDPVSRVQFALDRLQVVGLIVFNEEFDERTTMALFHTCMLHTGQEIAVAVRGIHGTAARRRAWEHMKQHPQATVTIDLFQMGLIFHRPHQAVQHFNLRY